MVLSSSGEEDHLVPYDTTRPRYHLRKLWLLVAALLAASCELLRSALNQSERGLSRSWTGCGAAYGQWWQFGPGKRRPAGQGPSCSLLFFPCLAVHEKRSRQRPNLLTPRNPSKQLLPWPARQRAPTWCCWPCSSSSRSHRKSTNCSAVWRFLGHSLGQEAVQMRDSSGAGTGRLTLCRSLARASRARVRLWTVCSSHCPEPGPLAAAPAFAR